MYACRSGNRFNGTQAKLTVVEIRVIEFHRGFAVCLPAHLTCHADAGQASALFLLQFEPPAAGGGMGGLHGGQDRLRGHARRADWANVGIRRKNPRLFWPAEDCGIAAPEKTVSAAAACWRSRRPRQIAGLKKASSPFEWIAIAACGQRFSNFASNIKRMQIHGMGKKDCRQPIRNPRGFFI